jgi:O-antigen ligase
VKKKKDSRRPWLKVLAGGMAGVVLVSALVMAFPYSRERVMWSWHRFKQGGVAYLLEGRYYHWGNTLVMIREHPLLGVGPGNFQVAYPLYCRSFAYDPFMNYRTRIKKAHNDYLQLAAECGIPALFFFLLLWGRQFYLLRYPENDGIDGEEGWRLPLAGSLGAYSIIMLFSFPLEMAYGRMFFFFLIGLGEARAWSDKYIFRRRSVWRR